MLLSTESHAKYKTESESQRVRKSQAKNMRIQQGRLKKHVARRP